VKPLTLTEALLPLFTLVGLLVACATLLELSGEMLVLIILAAAAVAAIIAKRHGVAWDEVQRGTGERLGEVLPALLILLSIGMLIATWVLSGTIPFLVYWGVRIIDPSLLLLTAFLATALMSLCTGTSWGSAGTMGVALMGMAAALDAPLAAVAGAVVSGAYFGDKMSPVSDSTNICAIAARVPLYRSIRHLLYTAGPSFIVAGIVYGAASFIAPVQTAADAQGAALMLAELQQSFELNVLALLPPIVVVAGMVTRLSPVLAITASSAVAMLLGVLVQGFGVQDTLTGAVGGFRSEMLAARGVDVAALSASFHTLVQRGGLYSMATTLIVILAAFLLAAAMDRSGALQLLIGRMLAAVRSTFGLIASTMAAGATMIALTSHGGVTALVIGDLFRGAYRDRGLAPENLSRSLEDSVTITEPLMPWTVSAVFMATTLGVSTVAYAPWAVFCYGGPFFSLVCAATGFGIRRTDSFTAEYAEGAENGVLSR